MHAIMLNIECSHGFLFVFCFGLLKFNLANIEIRISEIDMYITCKYILQTCIYKL